jgi:glutaredoxin 3
MRNRLVMYSLQDCPTCVKVRRILLDRKVDVDEIFIDDDDSLQKHVLSISKQNTAPVFVHPDGRVEVGFEGETG